MKRFLIAAIAASLFIPMVAAAKTTSTQPLLPALKKNATDFVPQTDAFASALVVDTKTGKELFRFKPDKVWPIASLTKLMNAMVFLEKKQNMSRIVAITSKDEVGGGRLRVVNGSKLSIQDVMYSSIVGSANNAAMAMSRLSGLGAKGFVSRMNAKAKAIGLTTAHFADPSGMDTRNVMTARDMNMLVAKAFANPTIRKMASTAVYSFSIRNHPLQKVIKNTNHLLTEDNGLIVVGGKTGYLEESRHNLVVELQGEDPSAQPRLRIVLFGAPDTSTMFAEAQRLAEWAWNAYRWSSS